AGGMTDEIQPLGVVAVTIRGARERGERRRDVANVGGMAHAGREAITHQRDGGPVGDERFGDTLSYPVIVVGFHPESAVDENDERRPRGLGKIEVERLAPQRGGVALDEGVGNVALHAGRGRRRRRTDAEQAEHREPTHRAKPAHARYSSVTQPSEAFLTFLMYL